MAKKVDTCTSLNRLTKLRDVMASAKPINKGYELDLGNNNIVFDIGHWAGALSDGFKNRFGTSCGTSACVAGTAGLIPEFRKQGLLTSIEGNTVDLANVDLVPSDFETEEVLAFARFFGLTYNQAEEICIPEEDHYPEACSVNDLGETVLKSYFDVTPAMVVKKLDRIIKAKTEALERQKAEKAPASR